MGHGSLWVTALAVAVLVGVFVRLWIAIGQHDERERAYRHSQLCDHERRLRAIEARLPSLFHRNPPRMIHAGTERHRHDR